MGGDFSTGGCVAFVLVRVIMKIGDQFVYLRRRWEGTTE
jgi:hypothetical protein